jgi:hypothetical protein
MVTKMNANAIPIIKNTQIGIRTELLVRSIESPKKQAMIDPAIIIANKTMYQIHGTSILRILSISFRFFTILVLDAFAKKWRSKPTSPVGFPKYCLASLIATLLKVKGLIDFIVEGNTKPFHSIPSSQ